MYIQSWQTILKNARDIIETCQCELTSSKRLMQSSNILRLYDITKRTKRTITPAATTTTTTSQETNQFGWRADVNSQLPLYNLHRCSECFVVRAGKPKNLPKITGSWATTKRLQPAATWFFSFAYNNLLPLVSYSRKYQVLNQIHKQISLLVFDYRFLFANHSLSPMSVVWSLFVCQWT